MGNFWGKIYVQGQDVRSRAMHYHSQPQPAQPKASPKTFENGRLCKEGRPAAPNLLQSSSGCGPTVQLCPVSDWFPRARMGLTLSSVFGRLFGKKQMRILMGESPLALSPWHTSGFPSFHPSLRCTSDDVDIAVPQRKTFSQHEENNSLHLNNVYFSSISVFQCFFCFQWVWTQPVRPPFSTSSSWEKSWRPSPPSASWSSCSTPPSSYFVSPFSHNHRCYQTLVTTIPVIVITVQFDCSINMSLIGITCTIVKPWIANHWSPLSWNSPLSSYEYNDRLLHSSSS